MLEVKWSSLGEFRNFDQKISFDENSDAVILSKYLPKENVLKSEKIYPEELENGFVQSTHNISEEYVECVRFTDHLICCSTTPHGRHHRTDCYYEENEEEIRSVAVKYDFIADWQSLADDKLLLVVHNRQRHAVFDIKENRIGTIEENRLPHGYLSVGFFFPMDTEKELEELVRSGQEFRICSYLKTTKGDYALKDEDCKQTPFKVEFELPKVRFCSNPLYTAVIQFGHHQSDNELTWHLRVKYDSSNDVYSASNTVESPYEQIAMDCNDETLDLFVVGATALHRFSAQLPNLRQEHFIQSRLR
ncbi:hypothetical protein AAVH_05687 [Aphelenchoides avenae]|nr:hypothetical protein AAVH_05687 [Aphelenchus avenae]